MEVAGIEPETPCTEIDNYAGFKISVEALTKILTEISGADRQMLTHIVQRWGSLSDELKNGGFESGGVGLISFEQKFIQLFLNINFL